jgi:hypothetical protein
MNLIKRIWAFITRGDCVWLDDFDGDITLTIARKTRSGELMAERYWPYNIRSVVLNPDGTTSCNYIERWERA